MQKAHDSLLCCGISQLGKESDNTRPRAKVVGKVIILVHPSFSEGLVGDYSWKVLR